MTPEERIELIDRLPYGHSAGSPVRPDHRAVDELVQWIDARQEKAVAAEREACAKVAEEAEMNALSAGNLFAGDLVLLVASCIRARGDTGPIEPILDPADLRDSAPRPGDVDYPADHFGDLGGRG